MKLRIYLMIAPLVLISGCIENQKTVEPAIMIPNPYYAKVDPWLDHSIFGVETLIGPGILRKYDPNVFDCSEMAAYLEWMLEKQGFDTKICVASNFGKDQAGHAWVAINLSPRTYYIEPTALNSGGFEFSTIKPLDGNYADYRKYDAIYDDVYEVAKHRPISEFDWWNDPQLANILKEAQRTSASKSF